MPSVEVVMPWQKGLTLNHAYYPGGRRMRPEVRGWQVGLVCQLQAKLALCRAWPVDPPKSLRLHVRLKEYTSRKVDRDNRCKLVFDAVKKATGIDDSRFEMEPGTWELTPEREANIIVVVSW